MTNPHDRSRTSCRGGPLAVTTTTEPSGHAASPRAHSSPAPPIWSVRFGPGPGRTWAGSTLSGTDGGVGVGVGVPAAGPGTPPGSAAPTEGTPTPAPRDPEPQPAAAPAASSTSTRTHQDRIAHELVTARIRASAQPGQLPAPSPLTDAVH